MSTEPCKSYSLNVGTRDLGSIWLYKFSDTSDEILALSSVSPMWYIAYGVPKDRRPVFTLPEVLSKLSAMDTDRSRRALNALLYLEI